MYKKLSFLTITAVLFASCGEVKRNRSEVPKPDTKFEERLSPDELTVAIRGWEHQDLGLDKRFGVSADKAYKKLNLKQKRQVIVAVLDSGVDYKHEDLKDVMWVNPLEIPNNGIDDDGNGYIDDIHGWNFIGGVDSEGKPTHIDGETLEVTRWLKKLQDRVDAGENLSDEDQKLYEEVKVEVEEGLATAKRILELVKTSLAQIETHSKTLQEKNILFHLKDRSGVAKISSTDTEVVEIKNDLLALWDRFARGKAETLTGKINYYRDSYLQQANFYYNKDADVRSKIVGDNPEDFTDTDYGNNDIKGPDSAHGTHVAGTIAAMRGNKIGIDGIASNVKIMALRAVPNGDERDKDIALAVRYAADNGAHIINMSFGKAYSPNKKEVDEAFRYAAEKGVLFIHAAGNDSKNIDKGINNFPNSYALEGAGVLEVYSIPNWIEVGASTYENNFNLIAGFSNFGKEAVTLFAPGQGIYSTTPENNYASYNGTSMATPVTAGVAAMVMSEFPEISAKNTRDILRATVSGVDMKVKSPVAESDYDLPIYFSEFCETSGVVNVFNAISYARELSGN